MSQFHLYAGVQRTRSGIRMIFRPGQKVTFSQFGEDLIVDFAFARMGITRPTYLDLGASHPIANSNTYLFSLRGSTGICVEPDPFLYRQHRRLRRKDTCLNVGVGVRGETSAKFYVMSLKELNTFSEEQARTVEADGRFQVERVISVSLMTINTILQDNFAGSPDLISLDVEGLDLAVLQTLDFSRYRPKIFCIETSLYSGDGMPLKNNDIIAFMKDKDYVVYADTWANTIFVDRGALQCK